MANFWVTSWDHRYSVSFILFCNIIFLLLPMKVKVKSEICSVVSDSLRPHGLCSPWSSPGQNTGVVSLSLFWGIFPTQGSNPGLPHYRWILYQLSHKRSPRILEWVAYPFSSRSSWPRNQTGVSCIAGGLFTNWATQEAHFFFLYHFYQWLSLNKMLVIMCMHVFCV